MLEDAGVQMSTPTATFDLFRMDNLRTDSTGVEGAIIWVSAGEFSDSESDRQQGPRVMVAPGQEIGSEPLREAVSIRLTEPPQVLGHLPREIERRAVKFVRRNHNVLLRYWANEISTREMVDSFVGDDDTHVRPRIKVREPNEAKEPKAKRVSKRVK